MLRILSVLLLSFVAGALLAHADIDWPLRPGLIGAGAMLASAWAARRYWQRLGPDDGLASPERGLWHGLASYGLLAGHLAMIMWRLGPTLDLHGLSAHALAIDSWTLVLGAIASYWIARDPEPRHDERDAMIRTHGERAGHTALWLMLAALILALGFGARTKVAGFNQPMLAHVLILIVMLDCLVQCTVRLRLYWREAQAARGAP